MQRHHSQVPTILRQLSVAITALALVLVAPPRAARAQSFEAKSEQLRNLARRHGLPNANYGSVEEHLRRRFPALSRMRHDAVFVADPGDPRTQAFLRELETYGAQSGKAIVGAGVMTEYAHPFAFAPVTAAGGKVCRMDATDPTMGGFYGGAKTRFKEGVAPKPNTFCYFYLVDRGKALAVGDEAARLVEQKKYEGINCSLFQTGRFHHLKNLGVPELEKFWVANRAYVYPTGGYGERGAAAALTWGNDPHLLVQFTNPEWQRWLLGEGAYRDAQGNQHTRPLDRGFTFPIQE